MLVTTTCQDLDVIEPLLSPADIERLRTALAGYTVDAVGATLGLAGQAALGRADRAGVRRALRARDDALATLIRLFLVGDVVPGRAADAAFAPLPLAAAEAAGLVGRDAGGQVYAALDIRPYAQAPAGIVSMAGDPAVPAADWLVVSDLGADTRPGPLPRDHVLGIGAASVTLAQATPRTPVGRALDVGTGCGVQSLHLALHSATVVATDISARALRMAATTAALCGQTWELRAGSMLDPVADGGFDLVVANPPFVVSPGTAPTTRRFAGWDYRDSGQAGDEASATLVAALPTVLAPHGSAHLLANWIVPADGDWQDRVGGWFAGTGCDAWVWQREIAEPAEYVALWLRDAGLTPDHADWPAAYDSWLDWFVATGVAAVGMGHIAMWAGGHADPTVVLEDVPQVLEQPVGAELPAWYRRTCWLRDTDDASLLAARLAPAREVVRERADLLDAQGWHTVTVALRQSHGMRWSVPADDAIAALVAGCDGHRPLVAPIAVLAGALGRDTAEVSAAVLPVVRDLVQRGILVPDPQEQR